MIKILNANDWQIYKDIRLECLENTPWAFGRRYEDEVLQEDVYWQTVITNVERIMFGYFIENQIIAIAGLSLPDNTSSYSNHVINGKLQVKVNDTIVNDKKWLVVGVYCTPKYRGQGYVDKLLQHVIDYHERNNCTNLYLAVEKNNTSAIKLYHKFGFVYDSDLPARIMGDGLLHDEFLMKYSSSSLNLGSCYISKKTSNTYVHASAYFL